LSKEKEATLFNDFSILAGTIKTPISLSGNNFLQRKENVFAKRFK